MVALPTATLACYKVNSFKELVSADLFAWIDEHAAYLALGYFLVPLAVGFEDLIRKKAPAYLDSLTSEGQVLLLKAMDSAVEKKMKCFLSTLNLDYKNWTGEEIFQNITNPDRQLAEIMRAIHVFFESLASLSNKEIDFTTVLFKMKNGIPEDSWCYFPESNMPEQNLLKDPSSLASYAARVGKLVIIPDIEKERISSESRISRFCRAEKGSVICFPIRSEQIKDTPFVIRISADKAFFSEENKVTYEKILGRFRKRILIEYALSELKKSCLKKNHVKKIQEVPTSISL
ncbi:hypothetical protein [Methylobacter sp. BlB1]|uniref:hypothetical protein n=1 Tax=Methylobacter sp. BlB1 TaxID=2785914 RepID=UPI0018956DAC|nr:hypothetical protein [Methylobacter sp. BlB1]MBF6650100.1 hypothetical protein [Methylobacter sp. BlB1]